MKIDLSQLTSEDLEKMSVLFPHIIEEDEEDEEEDEDDEEDEEEDKLPPLTYELALYKNAQSQSVAQNVCVEGANLHLMPMSESNAALFVLNQLGQAVYMVSWDLVHTVKAKAQGTPSPTPLPKGEALTAPNK